MTDGSGVLLLSLLLVLVAGCTDTAGFERLEKHPDTYYVGGKEVAPPYGFVAYCLRNESACASGGTNDPQKLELTPELWEVLSNVNIGVNSEIAPISDDQHHGKADHWIDPPNNQGDCEDYAIRKHNLLIKAGLPESVLLYAVGFQNGQGHAVLWVVTDHGNLVLDNLTNAIRPADEVPYQWKMRQSQYRPWLWRQITTTSMPHVDKAMKTRSLAQHVPFIPHKCDGKSIGSPHCPLK